jgi:hypothetical protein
LVSASLLLGLSTLGAIVVPTAMANAATDSVTTCAGSGAGSLPAVVAGAAAGDTITFSVSCPPASPITLPSTLTITKNLTITGSGASATAVSGANAVRDVEIGLNVTVVLSAMTIEDGLAPVGTGACGCTGAEGGGVENLGTLTLDGDTVTANATSNGPNVIAAQGGDGGSSGAGAGVANGGTMTMTNDTVSHNTGGNGGSGGDGTKNGGAGGGGGGGGGIANSGTLTMSNDVVSDNAAGNGGPGGNNDGPEGGDGGAAGAGGGITNSGQLSLIDVTVDGNTTGTAGTGGIDDTPEGGEGGNVSYGGGIANASSTTMTDSSLSNNSATFGGGIANGSPDGGGGSLHLSDSSLSDNSAGLAGGGGVGNLGNATITNSTFSDNSTTGSGGGIGADGESGLTLDGSTLVGNSAAVSGGDMGMGDYMTVGSTVFAEAGSGGDCNGPDDADGSYNIDDDGTCFATGTNVSRSTPLDASLGALGNNGGPTETIALSPGSPAIDAVADPSLCTTADQRGVARPTPCDIGAYETDATVKSQTITITSPAPTNAVVDGPSYAVVATGGGSDNPVMFSIQVTSSSVCAVSGTTVTFKGVGTCVILANQYGSADYSAAPQVQQSFAVGEGTPSFTSPDSTSATVGVLFAFAVTTTGSPVPSFSKKGALPKGVKLINQRDGEDRMTGRPEKAGTFTITIKATFGKGKTKSVVTQVFTLTVNPAPPT